MDDEARHVVDVDEHIGAEGDAVEGLGRPAVGEGRAEPLVDDPGAGGEVPLLVELAVVGQVGLRRDPEDLAAVEEDGAVVEAVAVAKGGAHDDERQQVGGGPGEVDEGRLDLAEQHVLQEQVVDGVAGEAQLGEERDRRPLLAHVPGPLEDRRGIGPRVGHRHRQRARGHPREAVAVEVAEVAIRHGASL